MVLSFALISIDREQQHLARLRAGLSIAVYPVQYVVGLPVRLVDSLASAFTSRRALTLDNESLRRENLLLRSRAMKFAALESENRRLRAMLDSTAELGEDVLVADVLAVDTSAARRQLVINKGALHHVYVGQPIADAYGILGQVVEVGRFSSTAVLITDARHALPVQINRNGLRAIASGGETGDMLALSFVPTNADVNTGDLVVSSGLDHRFPAGYPVGEVVTVASVPGEPFAQILVKPAARVAQAREVLLVWPHPTAPAAAPRVAPSALN